jgi:hypothetical protein
MAQAGRSAITCPPRPGLARPPVASRTGQAAGSSHGNESSHEGCASTRRRSIPNLIGASGATGPQKLGGPLGIAILYSVLSAAYQGRLIVPGGLPDAVAETPDSFFAGRAVAAELGSPHLEDAVRDAFMNGMTTSLWVSVALAALGAIVAVFFGRNAESSPPRRRAGVTPPSEPRPPEASQESECACSTAGRRRVTATSKV